MSNIEHTAEQSHILACATASSQNIMIDALAGTGKTTTLELIEKAVAAKPILYLVFNKRNADEATERMLSTTTVRTFNSLGHRIWAKAQDRNLGKPNVKKSSEILRDIINASPQAARGPIWEVFWDVINGVAGAKAQGYVPEGKYTNAKRLLTQTAFHATLEEEPDDLVSDLINAVLTKSIAAAYQGHIDFNDQIYMPTLFGGPFPQFPLVTVDEYQDLSPINHAMLDKLVKHRLIGVGDPWQNIYGFRGAKRRGMDEARAHFRMASCPLSISFRCPQAIVEHVRWRVPQFQWVKEGGHVGILDKLDPSDISDDAVVICRNNAPLFRMALLLLSRGRSVSVAGSDVGPKLIAQMRKIGEDECSRASFLSAIADWQAEREAKNSASAADLADCMRVFAKVADGKAQAIAYAEHLFKQAGTIRLLTGHKAKGLEFDTVYHLDPWLCQDTEQDNNLRYVISTRSKDRLFEVNAEDIEW